MVARVMLDTPAIDHSDQRFGLARRVTLPGPLRLDGGVLLSPVDIAYETYGTLNADASNAVLICHALTGDQHVASNHPRTGKPGWWTRMVGEGRPIDPARHFIVCANVLGSCMGSSGPATINPATGRPWAMSFPVITIRDMVRAQAMLLDHLGIGVLHAVVGGSMGGMQALSWPATFPDRVKACVVIASTARHTAQNIAFHEVGRQAVMADPNWRGGDYHDDAAPTASPAVARMAAHITYLSVRCELVSLHHAGDGLFRLGRGAWRAARQRVPCDQIAVLPRQLRHGLAVSDGRVAGDRPGAERGGRTGQLRRAVEPVRP
jgi:homoserine O-acetyltransferase